MPDTLKQISFSKLEQGMGMPHLLDIQTQAFGALLQLDAAAHNREDVGLERVFKDLFPITDVHENYSLEFKRYALGEPKYSVEECIERDMTYSSPLKATLQLVVNEDVNGVKRPKNILEKEVYLGELPLLTPLGTFVINGAERVIVSQLHRSPGVVFEESTHPNGQRLISARIIPFRGSWVEFTVDIHDVVYVHIDKKKKFPATALLRALGYGSNSDILRLFFAVRELDLTKKLESRGDTREVIGAIVAEDIKLAGEETAADAPKAKTKKAKLERARNEAEMLVKEGDELTVEVYNRLRRLKVDTLKVFASYMTIDLRDETDAIERGERPTRRVLALDAIDPDTGEVVLEVGQVLNDTALKKLKKHEIGKVQVFVAVGPRGEHAHQEHARQGSHEPGRDPGEGAREVQDRRRGRRDVRAQADLLAAPPGRCAQRGDGARGARAPVLQPQALRSGARGPLQDQPAAAPHHAREPHGAHEG